MGRRCAAPREMALTQRRPEQLVLLTPRGHQPSFQSFVGARKGAGVVPGDEEQRGGRGVRSTVLCHELGKVAAKCAHEVQLKSLTSWCGSEPPRVGGPSGRPAPSVEGSWDMPPLRHRQHPAALLMKKMLINGKIRYRDAKTDKRMGFTITYYETHQALVPDHHIMFFFCVCSFHNKESSHICYYHRSTSST